MASFCLFYFNCCRVFWNLRGCELVAHSVHKGQQYPMQKASLVAAYNCQGLRIDSFVYWSRSLSLQSRVLNKAYRDRSQIDSKRSINWVDIDLLQLNRWPKITIPSESCSWLCKALLSKVYKGWYRADFGRLRGCDFEEWVVLFDSSVADLSVVIEMITTLVLDEECLYCEEEIR